MVQSPPEAFSPEYAAVFYVNVLTLVLPFRGTAGGPGGDVAELFRDPDGNLVNLFTPVTEEAIKRFSKPTATQAGDR